MTTPHYEDDMVTIYLGDCIDVMKTLPDSSVDSIVTDPPYGLGFMGRAWDALPPGLPWAQECLRVLKPGGHLLAFGGSRTWHRLAVAVEDAGFEIRDSIAWLYGSGFPKSLDVGKAIDKAGGASPEAQASVLRVARQDAGLSRDEVARRVGCTPSSVRDWEEGRSRAVGRAVEFITPSPEYRTALADLLGYTADQRRIVGVGGGKRGLYETGHRGIAYGDGATPEAEQWQGFGTALKPAFEPVVMARKPLAGTVAGNVLAHGTGALNVDACRVGDEARINSPSGAPGANAYRLTGGDGRDAENARAYAERSKTLPPTNVSGRWPANVVLDQHQAAELDQQSGTSESKQSARGAGKKATETYGTWGHADDDTRGHEDSGGASRFFYCPKADAGERPRVDGTAHPTVKPLALMRWLVRLITPPGGTVLEPFAGSGTTIEACILERFHCIAAENEPDYLPLILARVHRQRDPVAAMRLAKEDLGLFEL